MYKEAKKISIQDYMHQIGCPKQNKSPHYGLYHAFWRKDAKPSVRVDFSKNLWIDYATRQGGSIIDLVMAINNCTFNEAVKSLVTNYSHIAPAPTRVELPTSAITNLREVALQSQNLLDYLASRSINLDVARHYCCEVRYRVGEKGYYAVGFRNDRGGYVIRSRYFKGCSSSHPTTLRGGENCCSIFEGFLDLLSHVTLRGAPKGYIIVLNSTSNLGQVIERLEGYERIDLRLDNDPEGDRATARVIATYPVSARDYRCEFAHHKDINEALQALRRSPIS